MMVGKHNHLVDIIATLVTIALIVVFMVVAQMLAMTFVAASAS